MALKRYSKKEEIPENLREMYVQKGDQWVPDIEGAAVVDADLPDRHKEFRENNRKLSADLQTLNAELGQFKKRFEGVDPKILESLHQQIENAQADEEKSLLAAGKFDEVVRRRTKAAISESAEALAARTKAYDTLKSEHDKLFDVYSRNQATAKIMSILDSEGWRPKKGAIEDVQDRIAKDWVLGKDGKLTPRQDLVGEDGGPVSDKEYVKQELLNRRSFLFEEARGGGAGSDAAGGGGTGKIRISRSDLEAKSKYIKEIAAGKVEFVD